MFPQNNRLKQEKDIQKVLKTGKSVRGKFLGLKYIKNNLEDSRFTVAVGVKISKKAVVRNRIKRQIRAIIEEELSNIKPGYDVLVMVQKDVLKNEFDQIKSEVLQVLKSSPLL